MNARKVIKTGCGFWNITRYPRGGEFRRAVEALPFTVVRVLETYNDGSPREYFGRLDNGESVCVSADLCFDCGPEMK